MSLEIILSIFSIVGIGGIIGAFFTYLWNKKKEIELRNFEFKERRYKCIIILMYVFIKPDEMKNLIHNRPDIKNISDLKKELIIEWVNSWLFAGDKTITNFRKFLDKPNEQSFAKTVHSMRKELGNKKSKLPLSMFTIKPLLD